VGRGTRAYRRTQANWGWQGTSPAHGGGPNAQVPHIGRRRYALASLVIGVLVLTGCTSLKEGVGGLSINPGLHDFGGVPSGVVQPRFTVTKSSFGPTESDRLDTFVTGPFAAINNKCEHGKLKRSESCTLDVIDTPTALGRQTGGLRVSDLNLDTDDESAFLLGTGTQ
jgi:hypothetical protein